MLGLVISDSFKTVITIYILIPFLIIPQLLLSGIIVPYEKLNPKISNPENIPWYGEIITARWSYEALAVYQFKNNDYEKLFYPYDKAMSISDFKKNYWMPTLQNKISFCKRNKDNPDRKKEVVDNLSLIRNEVEKEMQSQSANVVKFDHQDKLYYDKLDNQTFKLLDDYFELLRRYYMKLYNKASTGKDHKISKFQSDSASREEFLKLKRNHHNEKLAEFVKNSNEINRIIEYKDELIQKIDPIFLDPENKFVKAHFYAPRKQAFGDYHATFGINVAIIWFMSILLYMVLYFRLLRGLLTYFEEKQFIKLKTATKKKS